MADEVGPDTIMSYVHLVSGGVTMFLVPKAQLLTQALAPHEADLLQRLDLARIGVTERGLENDWWDRDTVEVGQVTYVHAHPNADRLVIVGIDVGRAGLVDALTSASNFVQYRSLPAAVIPSLKVPFAGVGATLYDAESHEPRQKKQLKRARIRGVASEGMLCSERELGISDDHEDIPLLPSDAPKGQPLAEYLGTAILRILLPNADSRSWSLLDIGQEVVDRIRVIARQ